jgi:hypothetical protein
MECYLVLDEVKYRVVVCSARGRDGRLAESIYMQ